MPAVEWSVSQARLSPDATHVACNAMRQGLPHVTLHAVAADGTVGDTPVHATLDCNLFRVFWRRVGGSWELMLHAPPKNGSPHRVVRCADGSVATTFAQPPHDILDPAATGVTFDLTADGSLVAAQSHSSVAIWDTASGALVATHALAADFGVGDFYTTLSPGGRHLCVWGDDDVTLLPTTGTGSARTQLNAYAEHDVLFNCDESVVVALETETHDGSIVWLDDGTEAALDLPIVAGDWLHGSLCFVPGRPDRMCVVGHQGMVALLQLPPRDHPDWRRRVVAPVVLRSKTVQLPTSWRNIGRTGGDSPPPYDAPCCTWRWGRVSASPADAAATTMVLVYDNAALVTNGELETVDVVPLRNGAVDATRYALLMGADPEYGEAPRCASDVYRVAPLPLPPQRVLAPLVEPAVLPAEVLEMHVATWLTPLSFGGVAQAG